MKQQSDDIAGILLAESGEQPGAGHAELEARLEQDPELRAFRDAARELTRLGTEHLPDGAPSAGVLEAIEAAARRQSGHRTIAFPARLARVAAMAAALALMASLWQARRGGETEPAPDAQLWNVLTMVDAIGDGDADGESGGSVSLEAVARSLLRLQGFAADDEFLELEAMLPEGPVPTASQERNNAAAPAGTSV